MFRVKINVDLKFSIKFRKEDVDLRGFWLK